MGQAKSILDFEKSINAILAEYKDVVEEDVKRVTQKVIKQAARNVAENAPVRSGNYKNSITSRTIVNARDVYKSAVYAQDPHYRLTHLLEKPHPMPQGGNSKAYPHWAPAEEQAIREYERLLKEAIE